MGPLQVQLDQRGPPRGGDGGPGFESEVLDVKVVQGGALGGERDDVLARQEGFPAGPEKEDNGIKTPKIVYRVPFCPGRNLPYIRIQKRH